MGQARRSDLQGSTRCIELPYAPHPGQKLFHASRAKTRLLACGRRWGKDRACIFEMLRLYAKLLKRNQGNPALVPTVLIWYVDPTFPIGRPVWRELKAFVPKDLQTRDPNETERSIALVGGGLIEMKSADAPLDLVGVGLDLVILSEAAQMRPEVWTQSLTPALGSPGRAGMAVVNSTPKGAGSWFHELYLRGQDPLVSRDLVESWNFPSAASLGPDGNLARHPYGNPHLPIEEIEDWRSGARRMPDRTFRQEAMAEWIQGGGAVFRVIEKCIQGTLEEPRMGARYHAGIDLAKHQDFTVVVVADEKNHVVAFERWHRMDWGPQLGRIERILKHYNNARAKVDATGIGDVAVDMLRGRGLDLEGVLFTQTSKQGLIDDLVVAMEGDPPQVTFPRIPELVEELKIFEYTLTPSRNVRAAAPEGEGFYDDCVVALALANLPAGRMGFSECVFAPPVDRSRYGPFATEPPTGRREDYIGPHGEYIGPPHRRRGPWD